MEFAEQWVSKLSGAEVSAYLLMVAGVIWGAGRDHRAAAIASMK
jgi:hypothetical protein